MIDGEGRSTLSSSPWGEALLGTAELPAFAVWDRCCPGHAEGSARYWPPREALPRGRRGLNNAGGPRPPRHALPRRFPPQPCTAHLAVVHPPCVLRVRLPLQHKVPLEDVGGGGVRGDARHGLLRGRGRRRRRRRGNENQFFWVLCVQRAACLPAVDAAAVEWHGGLPRGGEGSLLLVRQSLCGRGQRALPRRRSSQPAPPRAPPNRAFIMALYSFWSRVSAALLAIPPQEEEAPPLSGEFAAELRRSWGGAPRRARCVWRWPGRALPAGVERPPGWRQQ